MTSPPGWYPDPTGEPRTRYWDGTQWSSSTQPLPTPRPARGRGARVALVLGLLLGVLVLFLAAVAGARLLVSSGDGSVEQVAGPAAVGPCTFTPDGPPARPVTPPGEGDVVPSGTYEVRLETGAGEIAFEVDAARVPCALASLRSLARQGYFDDTSCHRLTTGGNRVLQCGDPTGSGSGGPGYVFADEALAGATYERGTVAMANRGPGTNGSQFFIAYGDAQLPPDYTPLGRVTAGLDLVDAVAAAGSDDSNGPGDGRPRTPVLLERVTVQPR